MEAQMRIRRCRRTWWSKSRPLFAVEPPVLRSSIWQISRSSRRRAVSQPRLPVPSNKLWRFTLAARRKTMWLALKQLFVRPFLSSRKELVRPKGENETSGFICASAKSRRICPNGGGGAWPIRKKDATCGRRFKPRCAR